MTKDTKKNSSSSSATTTRTTTATATTKVVVVQKVVRHLSTLKQWKEYDEDLEMFVQQFPKIELHVHLDGSFDPDVLWEYLKKNSETTTIMTTTTQDDNGNGVPSIVAKEALESLPVSTFLPWEESDAAVDPSKNDKKYLPVRALVEACRSAADYRKLCTCRGHGSLKHMLRCFEIFLPTVRGNLSLLEQMAYDFCQRQWQQHVIYTEVRYSPFLLAEGYDNTSSSAILVSGEDVLLSVSRGLRRGCQTFGITVNQILCCITWRPDWAQSTVELAHKYRHDFPCAVVGVDIAAGEEHFDATAFPHLHQPHYHAIQQAKALNIPITMHAGEVGQVEYIRRAVHEYGATRIGHGYRIAQHPNVMEEMKRLNIHFEICPTSSVETGGWACDNQDNTRGASSCSESGTGSGPTIETGRGQEGTTTVQAAADTTNGNRRVIHPRDWKRHPCRIMQSHGLSVSLNSDDPAVFHTSLAWQYRIALAKMKMSRYELYRSNLQALDAAFLPNNDNDNNNLRQQFRDQITRFCQSMRVIDEHGRPIFQEEEEQQQQADADLRKHRRSWSENFKDRVYVVVPTTPAQTAATTTLTAATAAPDGEQKQQVYL